MIKIAVVIPAFNEEKSIEKVVSNIYTLNVSNKYLFVPIVVNDCSVDNTLEILEKINCITLDLPVNLGIGGAVQTGFKYAFDYQFDYAIQSDGDGQHPAEEIPNMVDAIQKNKFDVVIGSRFIDNKGFQSTFIRRIGIKYFKNLLKILCNIEVNDPTSGFRIINREALAVVYDYYPDEYPEPESLVLYKYHNLKIGETAVNMVERQGGKSSIRGFSSMYYMIKVSLAIFFTFIKLKSKLWKMSSH